MSIIESLCFSSIVASSYKDKKYAFLWLCFIFTLIFLIDYSKLWLVCVIIVLFESFYNRKFRFLLVSQMIFATLMKSCCYLVSLLIISTIDKLPVMVLAYQPATNLKIIILYLCMYSFISAIIYHFNINVKERSYSNALGLLLLLIYYIIQGFSNALQYGSITLSNIQEFSIAFILFGAVLIYIMYLFNKENEIQLVSQKETMVKENLILIEGIQRNILDLEHRMNYVLLSLKHAVLENNKEEALKIIQDNTWNLKRITYYVNTGNPVFDNLFSNVMKQYIDKGIKPSLVLEVPKNSMDQDMTSIYEVIEFFTQLLIYLNVSHLVAITIQVKQTYKLFIIHVQNVHIDEIKLKLPKSSSIKMVEDQLVEIKIIK